MLINYSSRNLNRKTIAGILDRLAWRLRKLFLKNGKYVYEKYFETDLRRQKSASQQTLASMRRFGMEKDAIQKLAFFFYTNTAEKAKGLTDELVKLGYEVNTQPSAYDKKLMSITGSTTPLSMDRHTVVKWVEEMARLGLKFDCEFDGWEGCVS